MEFKDRFTELREELDMKQKTLATLLQISASAVSKYEAGTSYPSIPMLIQIARCFKVTVDYLLGLSSVKNPYAPTQFTPQEAELIIKYRRLNKEDQVRIDERINTILDRK